MLEVNDSTNQFEVHDPAILAQAKAILDACSSPQEMQEAVLAAVTRNEEWRGKRCLNLLAPEAPTSPAVRALLSAEIGTRAAEGHIGAVNRWFAGTRHIDEVEALCVELLKRHFRCAYADHRMCASMIGNAVVYTALSAPGDVVMSAAQPIGGTGWPRWRSRPRRPSLTARNCKARSSGTRRRWRGHSMNAASRCSAPIRASPRRIRRSPM